MIKDLTDTLLSPDASIRQAIRCIDVNKAHVVLVVGARGELSGTVTDGDIRRGILRGLELSESVVQVMNPNPTTAHCDEASKVLIERMTAKSLRHLPVVDDERRVLGIATLEGLLAGVRRENWVFLMAGGLGTRLRPLTDSCPKPLLPVGGKPVLETILERFIAYGFRRFFISTHYKAEAIRGHFGDGSPWNVEIRYVHEDVPLGTAGALGLLPEVPSAPLVVMNGDILTKVSFEDLLDFHVQSKAAATMCVREYDFQVPYGTVDLDDHRLVRIVEKPVHSFYVNAGIYVLSPEVVRKVRPNVATDMPSLLAEVNRTPGDVVVFPVHEYWLDIGQLPDFERAQMDFAGTFQ